ncbi:MAG: FMN-binding negative transcriptional regulator [Niveispirillum sp.]|nr:FMN-binding negative transcriptional regulator [Niveispirillum sp.]
MFEQYAADDLRDLIAQFPLAWVTSTDGEEASLLPLVGRFGAAGELTELIGHLTLANPLRAALIRDPGALILFKGPDAYISPSHAGRRDWGPTWNYAQARVWAEIAFDPDLTGPSLELLADRLEHFREHPWHPAELGARYQQLARHIIGFRARVTRVKAKFKLGQDERPETLHHILDSHSDPALLEWMRRFNPGRLP